jgi:hypothetical protein
MPCTHQNDVGDPDWRLLITRCAGLRSVVHDCVLHRQAPRVPLLGAGELEDGAFCRRIDVETEDSALHSRHDAQVSELVRSRDEELSAL